MLLIIVCELYNKFLSDVVCVLVYNKLACRVMLFDSEGESTKTKTQTMKGRFVHRKLAGGDALAHAMQQQCN